MSETTDPDVSRRGVVRAATWAVPVVAVAAAAPAYAASETVTCTVTPRWYRLSWFPSRHRYKLTVGCGKARVLSVTIDGKAAERLPRPNDAWWAIERTGGGDRTLAVVVTTTDGTWSRSVRFTEWED